MFYGYFRAYNLICNVFGLIKPTLSNEGKSIKINLWLKLWSLSVAAGFISSFFFSEGKHIKVDLKYNLELVTDMNDLVANVLVLIINLIKSEDTSIELHEIFNEIFRDLNFDGIILKLFVLKMFFWFSSIIVMFFVLIIMECVYKYPPYILLIRMPTFLSILHLIMHLYLILALVKVINHQLSRTLICNDRIPKLISIENMGIKCILQYVVGSGIEFMEQDNLKQFDLKFLCKFYDNLSTSIRLLEKCYGFQVFLSIWLMFISAVVGLTVIVCNQATLTWLVISKSILPMFWCFIGCYINEQLSKEVDQTNTLIIKCLIDYKCDQTRKPILETFKELVSNDRLQFTACSLFNLSYAMLLGTLLNVITYSIILIQMLL